MTTNLPETADPTTATDATTVAIGTYETTNTWLDRLAPVFNFVEDTTGRDLTPVVDHATTWTLAEARLIISRLCDRNLSDLAQGILWCSVGLVAVSLVSVTGAFLSWVLWAVIWTCVSVALSKLAVLGWKYGYTLIYPAKAPLTETQPVVLQDIEQTGIEQN